MEHRDLSVLFTHRFTYLKAYKENHSGAYIIKVTIPRNARIISPPIDN